MTFVAKRVFGLFLLAFGLAMAIAALADHNWVDQKQLQDSYGTYRLGLQEWQIVNKPGLGDGPRTKYSDPGMVPWLWNENLMGAQMDWQDAGRGALGLGVIAIIALGFALIFTLVSLAKQDFSKAPASIMAFISGFCFLLGAVIYEGVRPSWGGDMGYNHPIGLYLAAGLMSEIACIVLWSADYTGAKRYDNTRL